MKFYYALKKEFIALLRNRSALIALFLMPMMFILIMSLALKDVYNEYTNANLEYVIVNLDKEKKSEKFIEQLKEYKNLKFVVKESLEEVKELTRDEVYKFALVINSDFSKNLYKIQAKNLIEIYTASTTKAHRKLYFESKIAEKIMALKIKKMVDSMTMYNDSVRASTPSEMIHSHYLYNSENKSGIPTATQQNVPAWIVFSMFFVIIPISTLFITERNDGTFARLKAMNSSKFILFFSKIIPYMVINQLQLVLMILVGVFIVPLLGGDKLDVHIDFVALFVISMAISFGAIGFAILLSSLMKTTEQASTVGALSSIIMGAVGGIMVPKLVMPPLMQDMAMLSPMSWGLEGMLDVFVRNLGVEAVLLESGVLVLFGIISLSFAFIFYERRL
ncbi:ABC transporter permease [Sulfurovum sp. bin170]|uniref:ABC transporter permease n=1 Tax=Sulfurovum sp. bin170 TaxID=2695268 RepID=UPI0013DFED63|nr:ABC transporter permease [Sulfurovum sp. bin170]NEW61250.1 ABC transporter permease [Sulfurovum sp. bin170]